MRHFKKIIQFIALLFVAFLINSFAKEHLKAVDHGPKQGQQLKQIPNLWQGDIPATSALCANKPRPIHGPAVQFVTRDMEYAAEPGILQLFAGPNSRDLQMVQDRRE